MTLESQWWIQEREPMSQTFFNFIEFFRIFENYTGLEPSSGFWGALLRGILQLQWCHLSSHQEKHRLLSRIRWDKQVFEISDNLNWISKKLFIIISTLPIMTVLWWIRRGVCVQDFVQCLASSISAVYLIIYGFHGACPYSPIRICELLVLLKLIFFILCLFTTFCNQWQCNKTSIHKPHKTTTSWSISTQNFTGAVCTIVFRIALCVSTSANVVFRWSPTVR